MRKNTNIDNFLSANKHIKNEEEQACLFSYLL